MLSKIHILEKIPQQCDINYNFGVQTYNNVTTFNIIVNDEIIKMIKTLELKIKDENELI